MTDLKFDLIKELGLEHLSDEEKNKFRQDYAKLLEEKIASRIMDELPEEKVKELEALISSGKNEESNQYIVDNVPDIDMIAKEEFDGLKRIFVATNQSLVQDIEKMKNKNNPS